jgi:putative tryptophan/tyrosine transport system substrate-binding protein
VNRRQLITLLGGAVTWPLAARAQQRGGQMRRIGVLAPLPETDAEGQARIAALRKGLQDLGWTEGRNIQIDYRATAGDQARSRAYAAELVALKPDVIVVAAVSESLSALQRETRTIPIVFTQIHDPVASGFVASLARPGANVTGFSLFDVTTATKWLELLRQIAPGVTRAGIIYDPGSPSSLDFSPTIEAGASPLGLRLSHFAVRNGAEIERAVSEFGAEANGGLIVLPGSVIVIHRELIVALEARHRLPAVHALRYFVALGGLASYGVDNIDQYRQAASYVHRILKGERPADLPVQAATKFELVINLKTAKALGLDVPPTLLAIADEVIE